jgi:phosphate starvation-inducible protein PhoH and related proteins
MSEATITLDSSDEAVRLFGSRDQFLRLIRTTLGVRLIARGDTVQVSGTDEQVEQAERVFQQLRGMLARQGKLTAEDVRTVLEVVRTGGDRVVEQANAVGEPSGRFVRPRTDGQARYVRAMRDNDLVLCIGPAGTGKTYLAVALAVSMLRQGAVKKIVLVRPAVEAGERLGFLPGDIAQKVNPYLRPLFDALNDLMESEQVKRYLDNDIIEIVPLAFMRGRAQPRSSPVLTPTGFRPIGALRPGDEVIGSDGTATQVLGVYSQGPREVYRVTMTDRTSTRCCGEHLWTVLLPSRRGRPRRVRVLQTREMIGRLRKAHQHRYELPLLSGPVAFPARDVPMDPYALGLLLGDGCLTGSMTPAFATEDRELVGALQAALPETVVQHKEGCNYTLSHRSRRRGPLPNPVTAVTRQLELWGTYSATKFVPPDYLTNSAEVRLSVLQGLLDSDGGAASQEGRTCRVQYVTTSARLRDDVLFLVRSLGGVARWRRRAAVGRKPGRARGRPVPHRLDSFIVEIRLPPGVEPFRLRRKAERYRSTGGGRPQRYITRIEPDGMEDTVCIRVAAPDALYVTDDFILTHNTLNRAVIILDEGQNTTVPQMKMFLTRMGEGSKIVVTGDVTQVDLPKQTRSGLNDAMHRLRDLERIALVYLDENDIVRHPLVQQIVRAYEAESPKGKRSPGRG